jgi:hypothetical protein
MSLSPRLLHGGIVQADPTSGRVLRVIALQYNPDTISRTLQVQAAGGTGGGQADRSQVLRLKGAAIETIKLEAELDATDALEHPGQNATTAQVGLHPQLALLESLVNPRADALAASQSLLDSGAMEILPPESPMTLFVWSRQRVAPVRVTELSVTEEAFDPALNPIRAKVSLGLRVLSVDDVPAGHRLAAAFMGHLRTKERLATLVSPAAAGSIGFGGLS